MHTTASRSWQRAKRILLGIPVGLAFVVGCDGRDRPSPLFERLSERTTGVAFVNELPESPDINILNYLNYYNGGGVAAGDIDGDGLVDLFFTSNLGPDRLYRNVGEFQFEDVTERAGVAGGEGWTSGVTMADINGDRQLDIYVSAVAHLGLPGGNALYVNNGDGTFTERAAEYGLAHVGYSTQAAFFDYDMDGDLDMYQLNHSTHEQRAEAWNPLRETRHPLAGDRLFRNDDNRFVDVSEASGIFGSVEGYGLGVVISDLDVDGCPDIFVANDFHESDLLYFNNCDGTFTEAIESATGHTSLSSMGVDAADFSNDGRPDLVVLDMLPAREDILKSAVSAEDMSVTQMKLDAGYHPQYTRNTLQLNRGMRRFSDIAFFAGVHATDWSWAPLFADLDNDGNKDLFITNGIYRRPNDLDFIGAVAEREIQESLADGVTDELLTTLLPEMPHVAIANFAYRNNGDLTFVDMAESWGLGQRGFSTGALYADLDNDGALDLVVNNINEPAGIYRNRAREISDHHYLAVRLEGSGANSAGIGTKVTVHGPAGQQLLEQMPTRGFQSSVDPRLHFGLGASPDVDSLVVVWPDRRYQVLRDVAVDQVITLSQGDATGRYSYAGTPVAPLFQDVSREVDFEYTHAENTFFDYTREPLIPHQLSLEGPGLAVGDVNGDGLDDLYAGGAKWQPGALLLQTPSGAFRRTSEAVFRADSLHEDVDAVFFDANGDGHLDLYVVSAGNEFWGEARALRDRLYLNDGHGEFRRDVDALPEFFENGCCAVPGDFDGDGDLDLFVGSRVLARRYGVAPRSYVLQNDGSGRFSDVTVEKAEPLARVGMVTAATWVDDNADGQLDLVVVGEWMPIRVFRQVNGTLVDRTAEAGFAKTGGWWNSVTVADLQADGMPDLILGNLGMNSLIRASPEEPARLYVHDFSEDGAPDQVLTIFKHGESYPLADRDLLFRAVPQLRERYRSYADFGASQVQDVFSRAALREAELHEAYLFSSSVALNDGSGMYDVRPLPTEAQFAPVYAALPGDFDRDGHTDVIVAGNFFGVPPVRGRYDASYGVLLAGDGVGGFGAVDLRASELVVEGQVRALAWLRYAGGRRLIVVARNNGAIQVLDPLQAGSPAAPVAPIAP